VIGDQGMVKRDARTSPSSRYFFGTRSSQQRAFLPLFVRDRMPALLALVRDQERLGIMRRVAIDQYRITASIAPQMSIITSRSDAVRDGTKD
jgi:hypothetical protein